jgi:hypothetical protein
MPSSTIVDNGTISPDSSQTPRKRQAPMDSDVEFEASASEVSDASESEASESGSVKENVPQARTVMKKRPKPKVSSAAQRDAENGVSMFKERNWKPVAQTSAHRKYDPSNNLVKRFKIPTFTDGRVVESSLPPVLGMLRRINMLSRGLHDPEADGAIVLHGLSFFSGD